MRFLPLALLLFFGLLGCKSVRPTEVYGTWIMNDASRRILPTDLQKASAKIVLNPNGTFIATDMPGLFYFPKQRDARLESGNGIWKLGSSEGRQQVELEFHEITDWKKDELPYGIQVNISRSWSSPSLYYFLGDADEGRRIEFEKK